MTNVAIDFYQPFSKEQITKALALDTGLMMMSLMLLAEEKGWQTVPMTGYNSAQLRETFAISDRYVDIMMLAIGKGTQEGHRTLRYPVEHFTHWNKFPQI